MVKVKILFIGPNECGKTALSNFLSDTTESIGADYYSPTQGVRILEFESHSLSNGSKNSACEVELWDCAGDFKFESCWPALMKDSNGVVIVFNPDVPSHLKEIETWHNTFIYSQGLLEPQCLLIAHHKPGSRADTNHPPLAPQLNKLPLIHSNLEEDPEDVRQEFHKYLGNVMRMLSEKQEREEMSIIT
ncbi:intraflagellar transport protein 22 homolog [Chanodichthys erythropterus]|uniref:intraflagellar transport protein 22 homolog n=1 Tax=Chanodichthys erythropterus TaxID=933992 RepID=UPI00351E2759